MNIVIGDYVLHSDSYNFWITKKYKAKKRNSEETTIKERMVTGYHSNWNDLMLSFVRRGIGRSDANTMRQLMEDVSKLGNNAFQIGIAARESNYRKSGRNEDQQKEVKK